MIATRARLVLIAALLLVAHAAVAADRVKVRVGEHPGFARLVFDWPSPAGVILEEAPNQARLRFDRAGELDLDQVRRDPPPGLRGVTPEPGPAGLSVVIDIVPGSRVRLLQSGASAVLDILQAETPLTAPPARRDGSLGAPVPLSELKSPAGTPTPTVQTPTTVVPSTQLSTTPPPATTPTSAPVAKKGAAPLLLLQPPPKTAPQVTPPIEPNAAPKVEPKAAPQAQAPAKPAPATSAPAPTELKAPLAAPIKPVTEAPVPGATGILLVVADQGPVQLAGLSPNLFSGVPQTMNNLRFQWDAETALAVFRHGANLWLVFDREALGDVSGGLAELAPELAPVSQYRVPGATLIRMSAPPILVPRIARDETTWVIQLWPRPPRPPVNIDFAIQGDSDAPQIDFILDSPGRIVSYDDPVSGAAMVVVPALNLGQGLPIGQHFPQFEALRTFQGMAFEVADEGLEVRLESPGVRVTHPAGLAASHGGTLALLKSNVNSPAVGPRLFDLEAWRRDGQGDRVATRQALLAAVANAEPAARPAARLDLARFYFAHGLTSEAAGLLELAESGEPPLPIDPETRLMRGVSAFMSGDRARAARDIFHPSLTGEAEAELWNAALANFGFDWDVAARRFADHAHLIEAYPPRMRNRLRLMAAEAELGTRDLQAAAGYLEAALGDKPSADERAEIAVLTGYRHLSDGDTEKARAMWQSVTNFSSNPAARTRARMALLDLAVAEQTVTATQAIEELERLGFAWRGDHIELALLQRLGDLYLTQGRFRDSLNAFRQATQNLPNSRLALDVAERMREVFYQIIAGERGADLPPLSTLVLYEEFKELTSPGVKGDRMLTRLAERLVAVDLLPRAAEIMTSLVRYRLSGEEKAAMGARVADLHLQDDHPEQAITILGLSEDAGLPDNLKRRRLYLRAQALSRLSRFEEALKLIAADDNPEALRLRADILWAQANWPATVIALDRLVPESPRSDRPLTEEESRNVADLAIALTLAGEEKRLAELNRAYKEAMAVGPDAETFALLAAAPAENTGRGIAEKLAEVAKVEDFMARYRELQTGSRAN